MGNRAAGKGVATGQLGQGRVGRATQQGGATRQQGRRQLPAWYIPGVGLYDNKKQTYVVMRE